MDFKIIMLSKRKLEKSIKLIENSFNISKEDLDHPRKFLPASLDPKTKENRGVYDSTGCKEVKYFITIDEKTGKVIGIVGYYANNFDYKEADWLAWFVVDPNYRRKGIGKKLLEFIIKNARKRGKKFLRLYTDPKDEKEAQPFYEKMGLKQVDREKPKYIKDSNIIYREMEL